MDIIWYGQACFKIKGKSASVVIDPYSPEIGLKPPKDLEADLCLITHNHPDHNNVSLVSENAVKITGPGEYEVKGVAVTGVSVFHDSENGAARGKNTVYNVYIDNLNIAHLGDIGESLTEEKADEIGSVDILLIPVGGVYTIDAKLAAEVVAELEPSIIIPMHYGIEGLKYPLDGVDKFLKEMGVENVTPVNKLTITKEKLPSEPQVIVLSKT
ncbi:MBL fold metallo-hydrolase [Candidatus Daviesbacteria bacterium]|nr:MBL fold metallo-hydrolase [Candidatus Daviesbacteria bacterium]